MSGVNLNVPFPHWIVSVRWINPEGRPESYLLTDPKAATRFYSGLFDSPDVAMVTLRKVTETRTVVVSYFANIRMKG